MRHCGRANSYTKCKVFFDPYHTSIIKNNIQIFGTLTFQLKF